MTQIVPVLGFLELSLGNPAAAHETLAPLAEMVAGMGLGDPGVVRFLPDEIEALIALGRLDDAEQRLLLLEERGRAVERVSALAAAARCRALLESARGADEAARASLTAAHAFHARLDQPFERARTLLAEGTIARRARRRSGARDALTSSLEIFDALGAARWSEKAAGELARIPGRPPADGELTATERRVAELVAAGGTNREVGAALFVTERTVEGHLSRIYAKLGLRSRADLIRYLGDRPAAETARQ
jgi:DNA-binding CsgD family transcriptional regulator